MLEKTAEEIREKLPNIYSRELVNLIFFEFYTKIGYIEEGLNISRKTAAKYLSVLEEEGFLLSDGEIVEQGTHEQLMWNNGKYEQIYRLQAEQYIGKSVS